MKLVTGGTGFLGAHLIAELLTRGYKLRAIKRESSSLAEFNTIINWRLGNDSENFLTRLEWVTGDILDYESLTEAMQGVKEVYHCAAMVTFWPKLREQMYQVNVEGTANVVNACLETGIQKLCYTSSIAALGRSEDSKLIDEETPWIDSPENSHYAISKSLAEREVWRGNVEGLKTAIVNPGVILGEGDWNKGSCRLLKTAYNGMTYYTEGANGYVDVTDVAWVMAELMERELFGERYVLVGDNLPIRDLFSSAAEISGNKPPKIRIGSFLAGLGWRFFALKALVDGKEPLITRETARTVSKKYRYSSSKIENTLNFKLKTVPEILKRLVGKLK